ncbi:carboxypeptidase-like regulatory domain-containing protein [Flavobacteriaceae bacterium AU392]|nr:carboxypeptidase-like regulatory domain-containing protein [Flavobacteriaceae bacterium]RKM84634.1 carboxypeptidase-like regulatory domain-containing protein [Flavobacteriaceae bacterium AU392]
MKRHIVVFLLGLVSTFSISAQRPLIKGSIKDASSHKPISEATVIIENTYFSIQTNVFGEFVFLYGIPLGEQILKISKEGYVTKRYPIVVNKGRTINLTDITLEYDLSDQSNSFILTLSDDELNSEDGFIDNISGLLQSSRDVFLNAAAFDFSTTFFRPRGLDNANGKILINGVEMNKQFNGRPQWSNWGGLNDVLRNQEFTMGFSANEYNFGDIAGTTNIIMRATKYRKGGRFSSAGANRSYQGRLMASYNSGILKKGWAYSVLISRRFGEQGFIEGTLYDANSFFASVEKQINNKHSLNFLGIYAKNRRGRSTALTDELFELKGRDYNPFWGIQDGEVRNTRVREIEEPIFMLSHFWETSSKTTLNTNISYQFGKIGNTRVDSGGAQLFTDQNGDEAFFGGARNPNPSYYQNLPSFFLQDSNPSPLDFQNAFLAEQQLINDGQFDFETLYRSNTIQSKAGNNATFIIQEDRNDDIQLSVNSILNSKLTDQVILNASVNYRKLKSENFANVKDLLGSTGYLDVDNFVEDDINITLGDIAQSDLRNRNRIVTKGDRYKYNYKIDANVLNVFIQAQFKYNKIDFYLGMSMSQTDYQRNGLFENGNFPGNTSFGKSEKLNFFDFGVKTGVTYKLSGQHVLNFNGGYVTKAPIIRNSFSNARQNNNIVTGLVSEKIQSFDTSYLFRSPTIKARLTGYYVEFKDGTDVSFFFTEDLAGLGIQGDAFVQEVLTNIERQNVGLELGVESQITPTIKLKAVAAFGQNIYNNNPNLYLTSDDFKGELRFGDGKTNLKNLHVAGGPERAYQLGFEYRDPDFWNIGVTTNYFSNAYIDPSALARSQNFILDFDGLPINNFDEDIAKNLLKQEELNEYMLVNITGGKSWRLGNYFIGFFATINNVLNEEYRTGGFEQSRLANYTRLQEDQSRINGPIFGNRYFFGNGTTYYINVYLRF